MMIWYKMILVLLLFSQHIYQAPYKKVDWSDDDAGEGESQSSDNWWQRVWVYFCDDVIIEWALLNQKQDFLFFFKHHEKSFMNKKNHLYSVFSLYFAKFILHKMNHLKNYFKNFCSFNCISKFLKLESWKKLLFLSKSVIWSTK
jgi:hypothetical protein